MIKKEVLCKVCGSKSVILVSLIGNKKIWRCQNCLLEWRAVFPSGRELKKIYANDYFSQEKKINRGYPDYDLFTKSFQKYFLFQFKKLQKYFPDGGTLIDVGCGPGMFLNEAKIKGFEVLGVDISAQAVKQARERYRIKVKLGTLEKINFGKTKADIITCFQTFEHMAYPLKFLQKAHQILKPSGLMLLTTPDTACFWRKILGKSWFSYRHQEHLYFWQKKPLGLALKKVKFNQIEFFNDDWRWYNPGELVSLLRAYSGGLSVAEKFMAKRDFLNLRVPFPVGSIGVLARK